MASDLWKPVVGFEILYEVSSTGQVRNARTLRVLKQNLTKNGYLQIDMYANRKHNHRFVHRLVLFAFVRPPLFGEETLHRNGSKTDNCLLNLRWGSHSENGRDMIKHGKSYPGESNANAKLTEFDVAAIRLDSRLHREIAEEFDVHRTLVTAIRQGRAWKHTLVENGD